MNRDPTGNERYRRWYKKHREDVNQERRSIYSIRKTLNLCPRCGSENKNGLSLCNECRLDKSRIQQASRKAKAEKSGKG
jgi:hypothetical protein